MKKLFAILILSVCVSVAVKAVSPTTEKIIYKMYSSHHGKIKEVIIEKTVSMDTIATHDNVFSPKEISPKLAARMMTSKVTDSMIVIPRTFAYPEAFLWQFSMLPTVIANEYALNKDMTWTSYYDKQISIRTDVPVWLVLCFGIVILTFLSYLLCGEVTSFENRIVSEMVFWFFATASVTLIVLIYVGLTVGSFHLWIPIGKSVWEHFAVLAVPFFSAIFFGRVIFKKTEKD